MSSTIKIKRPDMPVPAQASVTSDSVGRYYNIKSYTLAQMVERDAQWQEMVGPVVEALQEIMEWQVKHVKRWNNSAYDNAYRVLSAITEE